MADDKPIDTGKKTVTGRTIWRDPETGEDYSERSTTFEIDGVYYTMPTVAEDGLQYTDDQIRDYVKKYGASDYLTGEELPEFKSQEDAIKYAISRSATRKQKEEPMLQEQMQQFNEGGLRDEGGMVDEESGNEVPIGSTRKEVRDDIPAQVSEGEFVFPADVVRYLGLEKLMEMRQGAKMGLKQMEAMGQMGNSDEATMPDDMPFGMADLVVIGGPDKEPQEKAEGGLFLQSGGSIRMPDFDSSNQDIRIYVKEGSPDRRIPFFDGEPVIPIEGLLAQGYVLKGSAPVKTETEEAIPTGGGSDDDPVVPQKTPFQEAGGWDMEFGDPPDAAKVDLWIKEAEKTTGNTPMIATGVAAAFGGPLAAFVHLGNKMNAKGRDASFAKALAAAKKTATAGQVAKLNAIDKAIKEGADKNIFTKIVDGISNALGFGEKEKNIVTKVGDKAGDIIAKPETPDNLAASEKAVRDQSVKDFAARREAEFITPVSLLESLEKTTGIDSAGTVESATLGRLGDSPSKKTKMPMDVSDNLQEQINDAELELGIPADYNPTPYEASYSGPDERSLYDTRPFSFPVKKTVGIDAPVGSGIIPEMESIDRSASFKRNAAYDKIMNTALSFKNAYNDSVTASKDGSNISQVNANFKLRKLQGEFANNIIEAYPTGQRLEDMSARETDAALSLLSDKEEKLTPEQIETFKPPIVTSTSSSDDDSGPSLAERMQRDSGKGRDTGIKVKTDDVTIKDRTDSSGKKARDAGYKSALREKQEAKKSLEAAGFKAGTYSGGRAKGGLATRKK